MNNDRSSIINIGGEEYELLLTTRATKEIAGRYGGLENLGDRLMSSDNFEEALGEIIWLITLLANQSILIEVEILTTPHDLTEYKSAITEALFKGTQRNIESENDSKNAAAG